MQVGRAVILDGTVNYTTCGPGLDARIVHTLCYPTRTLTVGHGWITRLRTVYAPFSYACHMYTVVGW